MVSAGLQLQIPDATGIVGRASAVGGGGDQASALARAAIEEVEGRGVKRSRRAGVEVPAPRRGDGDLQAGVATRAAIDIGVAFSVAGHGEGRGALLDGGGVALTGVHAFGHFQVVVAGAGAPAVHHDEVVARGQGAGEQLAGQAAVVVVARHQLANGAVFIHEDANGAVPGAGAQADFQHSGFRRQADAVEDVRGRARGRAAVITVPGAPHRADVVGAHIVRVARRGAGVAVGQAGDGRGIAGAFATLAGGVAGSRGIHPAGKCLGHRLVRVLQPDIAGQIGTQPIRIPGPAGQMASGQLPGIPARRGFGGQIGALGGLGPRKTSCQQGQHQSRQHHVWFLRVGSLCDKTII